jgi:hypothetical protein
MVVIRLVGCGDKRDDFGDDCCDADEGVRYVWVRLPPPCIDFLICLTAEARSTVIRITREL